MLTRRTFLQLSAASAGVAVVSSQFASQAAANAGPATTFIGGNTEMIADMIDAGINVQAQRLYGGAPSAGATWPAPAAPSIAISMSIASGITYDDLVNGVWDSALLGLIGTAPAGSKLSLYHEPNNGANNYGITPSQLKQMQTHMLGLTADTNVSFGQIILTPVSDVSDWMGPDLDWYGLDIYDFPPYSDGDNLLDALQAFAANVQALTGRPEPRLHICECNSSAWCRRPYWFQTIYNWAQDYGNVGSILTHWNPTGSDSGPWLSGDAATIGTLVGISEGTMTNPGTPPAICTGSLPPVPATRRFVATARR